MPGESESSGTIEARRAIVVPRARHEGMLAAVSLQSLIEPIIARGHQGVIEIVGPPGSGKSTALSHLAAVLPNQTDVELCEEECERAKKISIVARRVRGTARMLATFFLSEWTIDDCMEYLAAKHRACAKSVLARLSTDQSLVRLSGSPQLICIALDCMAADESIPSAVHALRDHLLSNAPNFTQAGQLGRHLLAYPAWETFLGVLPEAVPPNL